MRRGDSAFRGLGRGAARADAAGLSPGSPSRPRATATVGPCPWRLALCSSPCAAQRGRRSVARRARRRVASAEVGVLCDRGARGGGGYPGGGLRGRAPAGGITLDAPRRGPSRRWPLVTAATRWLGRGASDATPQRHHAGGGAGASTAAATSPSRWRWRWM